MNERTLDQIKLSPSLSSLSLSIKSNSRSIKIKTLSLSMKIHPTQKSSHSLGLGRGAARAASSVLRVVGVEGVKGFDQRGLVSRVNFVVVMHISMEHGEPEVLAVTRAASLHLTSGGAEFSSVVATRLLALKLAFGLGAEGRGAAFPGTLGGFAEGRAVGFGGSASGTAHSGAAHSLAFGAAFIASTLHLTHLLGAPHTAHRLLAMNFTLGALARLAVHLAVGTGAHGVALGGAHGIIAEPFALRMAPFAESGNREKQHGKDVVHFFWNLK
jgi:hypothetical protein